MPTFIPATLRQGVRLSTNKQGFHHLFRIQQFYAFNRKCIEVTLSQKQASCPVCHLPAWVKDVKSDHHLDTVIDSVSSLDTLMLQSDQKSM